MWSLESEQGRWHTGEFQFLVDLKRPDAGWSEIQWRQRPVSDVPFQVRLPGASGPQTLIDRYVRQADLVATYAQTPDRTVRPQLVWRVLGDTQRVGVSLLVSVQTSLLHSAPQVEVLHQLSGELIAVGDKKESACTEACEWRDPVVLLQRQAEHSFVVLTHPADFVRAIARPAEPGWEVGFQLFQKSLEKGVIRRAQLRGIYVPREDDVAWARQCLDELCKAEPPLTT